MWVSAETTRWDNLTTTCLLHVERLRWFMHDNDLPCKTPPCVSINN